MDFIHFSYKKYVQQTFHYNPVAWPPDISFAQFHSRCSKPGDLPPTIIQCPCCGYYLKSQQTQWFNRSIYEDFIKRSSGICGYFVLLKSFFIVSTWLVILSSLFQLVQTYKYCDANSKDCYKLVFLYFIDYLTLCTNRPNIRITLAILGLSTQLIVTMSNLVIMRNLIGIKTQCQQMFTHNTLLVSDAKFQVISDVLQNNGIQNEYFVVKLKPIYQEYRLRKQSRNIFFSIQARKALETKLKSIPHDQQVLRQKYAQINTLMAIENSAEFINFIITFKHDFQAKAINKQLKKRQTNSQYLKYPADIRWKTSGEPISYYTVLIASGSLLIVIGIMGALFSIPLRLDFSLQQHSIFTLTVNQIIVCYGISFLLSFACYFYDMIVRRNCKHLLTYSSNAERVLIFNLVFAIVFYICFPLVFSIIEDRLNSGIMVYVIVQQAAIIIFTQVIVSIIDPTYYLWNTKKSLLLGDSYETMQYNQKQLNKKVECIKYPILDKLMTYFRIYAFCFGFAIVSPYMAIMLFVASTLIYLFEKRNIYKHYKTCELNVSVIIFTFMYFSVMCQTVLVAFLCTYMIKEFLVPWYYLIPSCVIYLISMAIKIYVYRHRYSVDNDQEEQVPLQISSPNSAIRPSSFKSLMQITDYEKHYRQFVQKMRDPQLFSQIDQYLRNYNSNLDPMNSNMNNSRLGY